MHGLGNDFVVIDLTAPASCDDFGALIEPRGQEKRARLADRHYGIGCDQLLILYPSQTTDFFLYLYNPDGSAIEACGNGTRCAARLWMDKNKTRSCEIETVAGRLSCRMTEDGLVEVDMGSPRFDWDQIPLFSEQDTTFCAVKAMAPVAGVAVNIGNPHCVFFIEDVAKIDLAFTGPAVEQDPLFPEGCNVEFAQIIDPATIRMRVWERGAGITQACGTGACATVVAAVQRKLAAREVTVILDGGDLQIHWQAENDHLLMTGPAAYVFAGEISL